MMEKSQGTAGDSPRFASLPEDCYFSPVSGEYAYLLSIKRGKEAILFEYGHPEQYEKWTPDPDVRCMSGSLLHSARLFAQVYTDAPITRTIAADTPRQTVFGELSVGENFFIGHSDDEWEIGPRWVVLAPQGDIGGPDERNGCRCIEHGHPLFGETFPDVECGWPVTRLAEIED